MSDYSKETDCLLPGQGECDFSALFSALESCGYEGNAIVEVYQTDYSAPESLAQSRIYLESV